MDFDRYVKKLAHAIWIEEGKPDGEQIVRGNFKLKDLHWLKATCIADTDWQILNESGQMINE